MPAPARRSWNQTSATWLMLLLGCVALGFTARDAYRMTVFLQHAERATGTVLDPASHPVIGFRTAAGQAVEFRQNGFISRPRGAAVPVVFDPADPAGTALAGTLWATWGTALWLLPMGLGFTLLPLFGFRARWRLGRG